MATVKRGNDHAELILVEIRVHERQIRNAAFCSPASLPDIGVVRVEDPESSSIYEIDFSDRRVLRDVPF